MPVGKGQLNKRLLVAIVLDRSASMTSVLAETLSGTNEQLSTLRDSDDAANTFVSLFTFNQKVTTIFKNEPAANLKDLGQNDYRPSGMTAMRDAVGEAIDFLGAEAKQNDDVLVVVISDGEENASQHFTSEQIAGRVKELQDSGWTFSYIGANQDLTKITADLGFDAANTLSFVADSIGTVDMNTTVSRGLSNYTASRTSYLASGGENRFTVEGGLYDFNGDTLESKVGDTVEGSTTAGTDLPVSVDASADFIVNAELPDVKDKQDESA